jgi:hypothetical protein
MAEHRGLGDAHPIRDGLGGHLFHALLRSQIQHRLDDLLPPFLA